MALEIGLEDGIEEPCPDSSLSRRPQNDRIVEMVTVAEVYCRVCRRPPSMTTLVPVM